MKKHPLVIIVIVSAITAICFYIGLRYVTDFLKFIGLSVADAQTAVETLRSIIETMAIIVAGSWTYERFIKGRADHPYPKIEHKIKHCELEKGEFGKGKYFLSVVLTVTNEGKTKLNLGKGEIHIRRIKPLSPDIKELIENSDLKEIQEGRVPDLFAANGRLVAWRELGYRELEQLEKNSIVSKFFPSKRKKNITLEPGQIREIQFDFLIKQGIELVQVISIFTYEDSEWEFSTLYTLTSQGRV